MDKSKDNSLKIQDSSVLKLVMNLRAQVQDRLVYIDDLEKRLADKDQIVIDVDIFGKLLEHRIKALRSFSLDQKGANVDKLIEKMNVLVGGHKNMPDAVVLAELLHSQSERHKKLEKQLTDSKKQLFSFEKAMNQKIKAIYGQVEVLKSRHFQYGVPDNLENFLAGQAELDDSIRQGILNHKDNVGFFRGSLLKYKKAVGEFGKISSAVKKSRGRLDKTRQQLVDSMKADGLKQEKLKKWLNKDISTDFINELNLESKEEIDEQGYTYQPAYQEDDIVSKREAEYYNFEQDLSHLMAAFIRQQRRGKSGKNILFVATRNHYLLDRYKSHKEYERKLGKSKGSYNPINDLLDNAFNTCENSVAVMSQVANLNNMVGQDRGNNSKADDKFLMKRFLKQAIHDDKKVLVRLKKALDDLVNRRASYKKLGDEGIRKWLGEAKHTLEWAQKALDKSHIRLINAEDTQALAELINQLTQVHNDYIGALRQAQRIDNLQVSEGDDKQFTEFLKQENITSQSLQQRISEQTKYKQELLKQSQQLDVQLKQIERQEQAVHDDINRWQVKLVELDKLINQQEKTVKSLKNTVTKEEEQIKDNKIAILKNNEEIRKEEKLIVDTKSEIKVLVKKEVEKQMAKWAQDWYEYDENSQEMKPVYGSRWNIIRNINLWWNKSKLDKINKSGDVNSKKSIIKEKQNSLKSKQETNKSLKSKNIRIQKKLTDDREEMVKKEQQLGSLEAKKKELEKKELEMIKVDKSMENLFKQAKALSQNLKSNTDVVDMEDDEKIDLPITPEQHCRQLDEDLQTQHLDFKTASIEQFSQHFLYNSQINYVKKLDEIDEAMKSPIVPTIRINDFKFVGQDENGYYQASISIGIPGVGKFDFDTQQVSLTISSDFKRATLKLPKELANDKGAQVMANVVQEALKNTSYENLTVSVKGMQLSDQSMIAHPQFKAGH